MQTFTYWKGPEYNVMLHIMGVNSSVGQASITLMKNIHTNTDIFVYC